MLISVGATPTDLARDLDPLASEGIAEIRPGNYVFLDRTPLIIGLASPNEVALSVVATVVSVGERHVIIDAGSKVRAVACVGVWVLWVWLGLA